MNLRSDLWNNLKLISHNSKEPWVLTCDFSNIWDAFEKKNGAPFNLYKESIFNKRISCCNLIELETHGGRFTWKGPKL